MNTRKKDPEKIDDLIHGVFENMGLSRLVEEKRIRDHWAELVGARLADIVTVERLEKQKLYVRVTQSVWKMELRFASASILQKVNNFLGYTGVKEIICL